VSTPKTLQLPSGVQRRTIETSRGAFAALEAHPVHGVHEREPALLVPGYTGSKEDFLLVLQALAAAGRQIVAIDMRGQYETPGGDDPAAYRLTALAADVAAIAGQIGVGPDSKGLHLLGHSLGGLVAREALLAAAADGLAGPSGIRSLTLMSSGPGALTGPRAERLKFLLSELNGTGPAGLPGEVKRIWDTRLEPEAVAGGVPAEIIGFLRTRLLHSNATGLQAMALELLACPDRTPELAGLGGLPVMVVYGENDDAWEPSAQEDMAVRLSAQRVCIPAAAHSPAVEAPDTTASTLTTFWNSVECRRARP
jgi:pimeloyl-ACP methyl ester carboxylesterase